MTEAAPAKPKRRLIRRIARPAVAVVVLTAAVFLTVMYRQAARQREAVAAVRRLGGWVCYNCRYDASGRMTSASPPGPRWLRSLLGDDFFGRVEGVKLSSVERLEGLGDFQLLSRPCPGVTDDAMRHVAALPDLQWLALSGTEITDAGLAQLEALAGLQRLWLDDTQVSDAGLEHLAALTRLRTLSLRRTRTSDAGLVHLAALAGLDRLHLEGTDCTLPGVLHLLTGLQNRSLPEALTVAGLAKCDDAGQVVSLDLSTTGAGDEALTHVERLPHLQWLFLAGTTITDAGLVHLEKLSELTLLDLTDTDVTDAGLEHLADLKKLRDVHLTGSKATPAGIRLLRQRLPGPVRIYQRPESRDKADRGRKATARSPAGVSNEPEREADEPTHQKGRDSAGCDAFCALGSHACLSE